MSYIENEEAVPLRLHNLQEKFKKLEVRVGNLEKRIYQLEANKHE